MLENTLLVIHLLIYSHLYLFISFGFAQFTLFFLSYLVFLRRFSWYHAAVTQQLWGRLYLEDSSPLNSWNTAVSLTRTVRYHMEKVRPCMQFSLCGAAPEAPTMLSHTHFKFHAGLYGTTQSLIHLLTRPSRTSKLFLDPSFMPLPSKPFPTTKLAPRLQLS